MIFSYYFDVAKTHLLNFGLEMISMNVQSSGSIEATAIVYIEEVINYETIKREQTRRTFTFSSDSEGTNHDLNMLRHRYADEKKWIFEVRNNKDTSQSVTIGLISSTALNNPIGFNILHDDNKYHSEIRASTLSAIENDESSPIIKQTMADANFTSIGYPRGFSSSTGSHNRDLGILVANEFKQTFLEEIPQETAFTIEMDIAPENMNAKYPGDGLFLIKVPGLLEFIAHTDRFIFLKEGQAIENAETVYYDEELNIEDFYTNSFTSNSQFVIEVDGRHTLLIKYAGVTINTTYNSSIPISEMSVRGMVSDTAKTEQQDELKEHWLSHKLDNLLVVYTK